MKVKQNYVSSQYHQVYFTFTVSEMQNIFEEVLTNHGFSDKEAKKKKNVLLELVMEKIESEIIEDEIEKLEVIAIASRRYRYLTEVSPTKPLLVICQFCILPVNIQLKFPTKIPKDVFEIPFLDKLLKDFTKQILIMKDEYKYVEGEVAYKGSIVKYDLSYTKDDFVISDILDQEITLDDITQNDRAVFLDHKVGDEIILDNNDDVVVTAKVTDITNFVVNELTDKIVENFNFLNTKTVEEFIQKIKSVFTFSTSIVILLNYLTDFVINTKEIEFDEYVIDHFMDDNSAPKKKKEKTNFIEDVKRDLVKEYIIWVINLGTNDEDQPFLNRIIEEYEFDKILFNSPMRIGDYQEYISRHSFEVRVLQYCLENNIIDLEL
jgi:hypothetical protein